MQSPPEDPVRPHSYDGIVEYDRRLPNWWLYTLYATIAFWIGYWSYYEWLHVGKTDAVVLGEAMSRIEASRLATAAIDDATLWKMSRNAAFTEPGKATFASTCAACHLPSMRGKSENPMAIGPDLTDSSWIHGGKPVEVIGTITNGVLTKGMPSWGPVLGSKKITEVAAYVLSKHQEGETVLTAASTP